MTARSRTSAGRKAALPAVLAAALVALAGCAAPADGSGGPLATAPVRAETEKPAASPVAAERATSGPATPGPAKPTSPTTGRTDGAPTAGPTDDTATLTREIDRLLDDLGGSLSGDAAAAGGE